MKRLLLALLAVALAAGAAFAVPALPENAVLVAQNPIACESGVVLRYHYELPDGGVIALFKMPNQEPRIFLRWLPGNDGPADEVWLDANRISIEALKAQYPSPCAVFSPRT